MRKKRNNDPRPSREWLEQRYIVENLSTVEVAALANYTERTMAKILRENGFPARGHSLPRLSISRDELHRLHVVEGLTAVKIAARLNCHNGTISRLIKRYGLDPQRPLVNIPSQPPMTRDELWKLYWVDQLSIADVATRYGVSRSTARRWFDQLDITRRRWNGGDFTRTYIRNPGRGRNAREFNALERERIFVRDGRQCRMPGCGSTEQLEVNHILPIRLGGTNAISNGITLCRPCHVSVTRREPMFAELFRSLIGSR